MVGGETARPVLLLGSVPLASATQVFELVGARLGALAPRVPDGETGQRLTWVGWQRERLLGKKGIEVATETHIGGPLPQTMYQLKLTEGFAPSDLELGPLGYHDIAVKSYADFTTIRAAGKVPLETRFQISLPTPETLAAGVRGPRRALLAAYEGEMRREVEKIAQSIPMVDLAIQWDVAGETQAEEARRHPGRTRTVIGGVERKWGQDADPVSGPLFSFEEQMDAIARACSWVPEGVELGVHLCYGDPDGKHIIEPEDMSVVRDMANALAQRVDRPIDWIHMPVPIERDDDAFFAPLRGLKIGPETLVYLGLVHFPDGIAGSRRRIAAATKALASFGIATECGLGRRPPAIIPDLLDLLRQTAELP